MMIAKNDKNKAAVFIFLADATEQKNEKQQVKQQDLRNFAHNKALKPVGFIACDSVRVGFGFRHAIRICQSHDANMIVVDETLSLALSPADLIQTLELLSNNGLSLYLSREDRCFDPGALMVIGSMFKASMAASRELQAKKIKQSLALKKKAGHKLGGKAFGSGQGEQYILRQILALHKQGLSLQGICQKLAHNNIKTVQGKKWHPTTVKRIIERAKKTKPIL